MGYAACQLAYGFHFLRVPELIFQPFVLGYVASDFRCADDFAFGVSEG